MSSNVMSSGIMVPLSRKLTEEEREEWPELLHDQGSDVRFNYDGTLAYTDTGEVSEYGISFVDMPKGKDTDFESLAQFGLTILTDLAKPYKCYWYNGADSHMDVLTLNEFLEMTEQEL